MVQFYKLLKAWNGATNKKNVRNEKENISGNASMEEETKH